MCPGENDCGRECNVAYFLRQLLTFSGRSASIRARGGTIIAIGSVRGQCCVSVCQDFSKSQSGDTGTSTRLVLIATSNNGQFSGSSVRWCDYLQYMQHSTQVSIIRIRKTLHMHMVFGSPPLPQSLPLLVASTANLCCLGTMHFCLHRNN